MARIVSVVVARVVASVHWPPTPLPLLSSSPLTPLLLRRPQGVYVEQDPFPPRQRLPDSVFDDAFGHRPTIIYFHGNVRLRVLGATARRTLLCSLIPPPGRHPGPAPPSTGVHGDVRTAELVGSAAVPYLTRSNVVAVDYRGFADSSGTPSQDGVIIDARTTWDWVAKKVKAAGGDPARNIILCGHSLGTGITSALAERLAAEGRLGTKRRADLRQEPSPAPLSSSRRSPLLWTWSIRMCTERSSLTPASTCSASSPSSTRSRRYHGSKVG